MVTVVNLQFSAGLSVADFCAVAAADVGGAAEVGGVTFESSFSSLIEFDASMLLCRLLMIWAGVSFKNPGTSSVDFERRNGLLVN